MVVKVSLHDISRNQSIDLSNQQKTVITIGRGGFFEIQDKRVSKNHGELTVLETTIKIKSCHSNPIFYKLKNEPGGKKVLRKDSEIVLGDSDIFSLLPDEFEWTVKVEQEIDQNENPAPTFRVRRTQEINDNLTQLLREDNVTPDLERTPSPDDLRRPKNFENDDQIPVSSRKRSCDELDADESSEAKKIKESTSSQVPTSTTSELPSENSANPADVPQAESSSTTESLPYIKPDPDSTDTNQQSSIDPNLPTTSNVKTEPVDNPEPTASSTTNSNVKPDPDAVKTEDDACCGQQQSNVRPSCEFGIRCYRMTDDHRREYAHPMDCDYRRPTNLASLAPPDAPRCPYWDACYRRNPEHFRDFQHPPSDQYAPQRPPQFQIQIQQVIQPQPPANQQNRPTRNRTARYNYDDEEESDEDRIGWDDDDDIFDDGDDSDVDRNFEMDGSISDEDDLDDEENNLEE